MIKWIKEELSAVVPDGEEALLVLDSAGFHKTRSIFDLLNTFRIKRAVVPGGSFNVNKCIKALLFEEYEKYLEERKADGDFEKWDPSKKRIMLTHIVARAVDRLQLEYQYLVPKPFVDCGISIRPDGSQVDKVRIKGHDWRVIDWQG